MASDIMGSSAAACRGSFLYIIFPGTKAGTGYSTGDDTGYGPEHRVAGDGSRKRRGA